MIRGVIFDFGGVLVRTIHTEGRDKWEKHLGLEPGELSKAVFDSEVAEEATRGVVPEQAIWDHLAKRFNLDPQQAIQLAEDFWSGDWLDAELVDFLQGLRNRVKTAILSNAWSEARLTFSQKFKLDQAVDLIIVSAEEGLAKPDASIYRLAMERLDILPEETIFVDDFPENVRGALSLGIHAILFKDTRQVITEIQTLLDPTE